VHAERLADQAPQAIAIDRVPCGSRADGHAEPGFAGVMARALDEEEVIGMPLTRAPRAFELGGGVELLARSQSVTPRRTSLVSGLR
jgi:hypothetical protein